MPIPLTTSPTPRAFLADQAYECILGAILDGTLLPGERLQDTDLIAWLGISRTPIREALDRLADQGFVDLAPHRYTRVAQPTHEDYADVVDTVVALHCRAVARVLPDLDDDAVEQFLALLDDAERELDRAGPRVTIGLMTSAQSAVTFFAERSRNQLVRRMVAALDSRVRFVAQALGMTMPREHVAQFLETVRESVRRREVAATVGAVRRLADVSIQRPATAPEGS